MKKKSSRKVKRNSTNNTLLKSFISVVSAVLAIFSIYTLFDHAINAEKYAKERELANMADTSLALDTTHIDSVQNLDFSFITSSNEVSSETVSDNSGASTDETISDIAENDSCSAAVTEFDITNFDSGYVVSPELIDLDSLEKYFIIEEIPDSVYQYINEKSYRENNTISLSDLRYIKLLHYNYNHDIQVGELIVNKNIADDIKEIFMELFINEYEIEKMYLPDRYWTGDGNTTDDAACDDNNTSAFFYRTVGGSSSLSNHAYGMAIDINPQQNPYVSYRSGSPECSHDNALEYLDRTSGAAHMITTDDLCYQLFISHGFSWGGNWRNIKDYQHFEM